MRRFFYAIDDEHDNTLTHPALSTLTIGRELSLTDAITHHWCRVLRANIGDQGVLFDGLGGEYLVQISTISKKSARATLLAQQNTDRTAPFISKIGLVMSRGDRMDYAIQKATELGATAIQLLSSHHGEVNLKPTQVDKKQQHWQQVAIAACEQCGLNRPPLILAPLSVTDWLNADNLNKLDISANLSISPIIATLAQDAYYQILHKKPDLRLQMSVPAAEQPLVPANLSTVMAHNLPFIELLIGPEGGLSADECLQATHAGFDAWQIGNRVLRTETAPVVALATLHALKSFRLS